MKSFPTYTVLAGAAASLLMVFSPANAKIALSSPADIKSIDVKVDVEDDTVGLPSVADFQAIVYQAWEIINQNYADPTFDPLNWRQVREEIQSRHYTSVEEAYAAIRAMLSQLNNPATRLLTPQQFASFVQRETNETYIGVGLPEVLSLDIDKQTQQLIVVTPAPHTPAAEAGLLPGDRILAIEGVSTNGMDLGEAAMRVRGPAGSSVNLVIQRRNSTFDVTLTRKEIKPIPAVQSRLETVWEGRQVGYIILNQFTNSSPQQLREALDHLQTADGFVLDLRNNPGGSVAALRKIAGFFLGETVIGAVAQRTDAIEIRSTGLQLTDKPLVVLVNQGTASAAEWLAGALLDYQRAVVVGTSTAGKGLVHSLSPLADGAALVVTFGQASTPSGRDILSSGVAPNLSVDMTNSPLLDPSIPLASWSDTQYRKAIEQLIMQTEGNSPVVALLN